MKTLLSNVTEIIERIKSLNFTRAGVIARRQDKGWAKNMMELLPKNKMRLRRS